MNVKIKICGITDLDNALQILNLSPDFLGFILYPKSPRFIGPEKAHEIISRVRASVGTVGVFVNEDSQRVLELARDCGFDHVQLHGDETEEDIVFLQEHGLSVIKAVRLKDETAFDTAGKFSSEYILFDTFHKDLYGGTGETINTRLTQQLKNNPGLKDKKVFLSGGLCAENIRAVSASFTPFAFDASSRLELEPGIKDIQKVEDFIREVRS